MATTLATFVSTIDSRVATWLWVCIPVFLLLLAYNTRRIRRIHQAYFASETALSGDFVEQADHLAVIRAYNAAPMFQQQTTRRIHRSYQVAVDSARKHAQISPWLEVLGVCVICVYLLATPAHGTDTARLFSLCLALLLLIRPVRALANAAQSLVQGWVALDRLEALFAMPSYPETATHFAVVDAHDAHDAHDAYLRADNIAFDYGDTRVLRHVSMHVTSGEIVGVSGESGAGKTTLLMILAGLLEPTEGQVCVNTTTQTRPPIAWVPQAPSLFKGSVLENIALGQASPDAQRATEALNAVAGHGFLSQVGGLQRPIEEHGRNLSLGQRQRIAIARGFYLHARVLLLDEPTSALDPAAEEQLGRALRHLADNHGVLVVFSSHRASTIAWADRVVSLPSIPPPNHTHTISTP